VRGASYGICIDHRRHRVLAASRPVSEKRTIYVPVEVTEQSGGGLGCLMLAFAVAVLLLAVAGGQF
jgi:hypothetical protein